MNKIKIIIEDACENEIIEKVVKVENSLRGIENIFVLLYETLAVDLGFKSEDIDSVLEKICFFPCISESDDKEIFIKDSEEFINKLNNNLGFREFMFDFYKKQMRIDV